MRRWVEGGGRDAIQSCGETKADVIKLSKAIVKHCKSVSESRSRGKHTWMAHLEGRHSRRSGMWFLEGLCKACGAGGFLQTVQAIRGVVQAALEAGARGICVEMSDSEVSGLLTAAEDQLVLAAAPGQTPEHAGPYNSVDAGRWIIMWLWVTGRSSKPSLSEDNYRLVMRGMSKECQDAMAEGGVASAKTLCEKAAILNTLAVACTPVPANFVNTSVEWPLALVHLCEVGQIARDIPRGDLSRALSANVDVTRSAVRACTADLQGEARGSLGCHAVLVTRAAVAACEEAFDRMYHERAGAGPVLKRPAEDSDRARQAVLKKPAFVQGCPVCGAEVRNDVMARHMRSEKCRQEALRRAGLPPVEARGAEAAPPPGQRRAGRRQVPPPRRRRAGRRQTAPPEVSSERAARS